MSNKKVRTALALAFGVVLAGNSAFGIPGGVPGLSKALTCVQCEIKTNKSGIPTEFAAYMTPEQKRAFKKAAKNG